MPRCRPRRRASDPVAFPPAVAPAPAAGRPAARTPRATPGPDIAPDPVPSRARREGPPTGLRPGGRGHRRPGRSGQGDPSMVPCRSVRALGHAPWRPVERATIRGAHGGPRPATAVEGLRDSRSRTRGCARAGARRAGARRGRTHAAAALVRRAGEARTGRPARRPAALARRSRGRATVPRHAADALHAPLALEKEPCGRAPQDRRPRRGSRGGEPRKAREARRDAGRRDHRWGLRVPGHARGRDGGAADAMAKAAHRPRGHPGDGGEVLDGRVRPPFTGRSDPRPRRARARPPRRPARAGGAARRQWSRR